MPLISRARRADGAAAAASAGGAVEAAISPGRTRETSNHTLLSTL